MEMSTGFTTSGAFTLLFSMDFKSITFQEKIEHSSVLSMPCLSLSLPLSLSLTHTHTHTHTHTLGNLYTQLGKKHEKEL